MQRCINRLSAISAYDGRRGCVCLTAEESGLRQDSVVLTEQVRTLEKSRLTRHLGTLTPEAMKRLDHARGLSLGTTTPLGG